MSTLEERYRRLLAFYPQKHRARHEEEMLGVMLAGAGTGRRRPDPREVFDLVRGGLQIRLRHAFGPGAAAYWRDALNIAALVAPLYLLVLQLGDVAPMGWTLLGTPGVHLISVVVALAGLAPYTLIVVLVLRGARRGAAVCAWGWVAAGTVLYVVSMMSIARELGPATYSMNQLRVGDVVLQALPGCVAAVLLTAAPRPVEGVALVGRRRLLRWAVVTVVALNVVNVLFFFLLPEPLGAGDLLPVALLAMACGAGSRTPAGLRAVLLLLPLPAAIYGPGLTRLPEQSGWPYLGLEALLAAVAFIVARRGFAPYGSGTVSSPERLV